MSCPVSETSRVPPNLVFAPPRSISDQIYEVLKDRILINDLEPGQRLIESEIAQVYQTSRTPVREAFRRLEQDGFVYRVPQGGVRVTEISVQAIKEICGIRAVLEAYVGELACDLITPETLAELKQISRRAQRLLSAGGDFPPALLIELWRLNTQFHDTIYRATRSQHLLKVLNNLRDMVLRFRILTLKQARIRFWEEHEQIIACLEARDKEKLCHLMKLHTEHSAEGALETLEADAKRGGG